MFMIYGLNSSSKHDSIVLLRITVQVVGAIFCVFYSFCFSRLFFIFYSKIILNLVQVQKYLT